MLDNFIVPILAFVISFPIMMVVFRHYGNSHKKNPFKTGKKWLAEMSERGYKFQDAIKILFESTGCNVKVKDEWLEVSCNEKKQILILHQFGIIWRSGFGSLFVSKHGEYSLAKLDILKSTIELIGNCVL